MRIIRPLVVGLFAAVVWVGLGIQLYLIYGYFGSAEAMWPRVIANFFSYFTNLSNITVVLVLSMSAKGWHWPRVAGAAVVYIIAVGVIYVLFLARLWNPTGLQWWADFILHYLTPIGYPLVWFLVMPKVSLLWREIWTWLIFPVAYVLATIARGSHIGWWPYPFLDPRLMGYERVTLNCVVLTFGFVVLSMGVMQINGIVVARRRLATP